MGWITHNMHSQDFCYLYYLIWNHLVSSISLMSFAQITAAPTSYRVIDYFFSFSKSSSSPCPTTIIQGLGSASGCCSHVLSLHCYPSGLLKVRKKGSMCDRFECLNTNENMYRMWIYIHKHAYTRNATNSNGYNLQIYSFV